jgi:hypothetical protein
VSFRSVPRSDYWTNLSIISEWITLHCVSEIFSATSNPSSQSTRMRSPILNTLMNSLSSIGSPQKSTCTGFFGSETSNSSARRPSVIEQTIPPASRQYLPAAFLHQSSAASGKLAQIPRLFDILRLHSPNTGIQKDVAPAGICRCSGAIRESLRSTQPGISSKSRSSHLGIKGSVQATRRNNLSVERTIIFPRCLRIAPVLCHSLKMRLVV